MSKTALFNEIGNLFAQINERDMEILTLKIKNKTLLERIAELEANNDAGQVCDRTET